tara:strand:- start:140 stop:1039 length:900 start_codon:yes stop_codon:yes gene_type:complete
VDVDDAIRKEVEWVTTLIDKYTPRCNRPAVEGANPITILFTEYIFSNQVYSKRGNLCIYGKTTLESYGTAVLEIARRIYYPTMAEKHAFAELLRCKGPPTLTHVSHIGTAHHYLKMVGLEHQLVLVAMLSKNVCPTGLCNVRVGYSQRHGQGVFAQRNLCRGDLITLHPCHYMSLDIPGTGSVWIETNPCVPKVTELISKLLYHYSASVYGTCISVAADPSMPVCPAACAHLINDGATMENNSARDRCKYMRESHMAQNCHLVPLAGVSIAAVASRDIQRNEEIYTSYGWLYWTNMLKL